jgi:hypothetical protein
MPIKGPRDANPRKPIREIRNNSYTERGRSVEIHRFLTRAKELTLSWQLKTMFVPDITR